MAYFQVKVRHFAQTDDGIQKFITTPFIALAETVVLAEALVSKSVSDELDDFTVEEITKPRIGQVLYADRDCGRFYRCKVIFGEEGAATYILVEAATFDSAFARVKQLCTETPGIPYEIELVQLSPVKGYFES